MQSEFYLVPDTSSQPHSLSWDRLLGLAPDYVTFNGRSAQYSTHPISVKVNELLRLYVVNAGPNRFSSFHVVGGIFERVFVDGSQASPLVGVQTVSVPVGGGSIFEIRLKQAGEYPFVTHAFADATKGAVGVFKADGRSMGGVRRVVDDGLGAFGVRAMSATIEGAVRLDAVADHLAAAVLAHGRQLLDRALEAVERVRLSGRHHLERHLVVIAAHFAYGHGRLRLMVSRTVETDSISTVRFRLAENQACVLCAANCSIHAS